MESGIWELRVTLKGYTFLDEKALLNERRRWWPIGECRRGFCRGRFGVSDTLRFIAGAGEFFLNSARQLVLAFGGYEGVFPSNFQIAVARNLGCLDRTTADLLAPHGVRA